MSFISLLWVLLLGSLLGLELIGKVPPTLHTPLMSGANAISGITMLAALTLIVKAEGNVPLLIIGSVSLGFALFNVVGGFFVTCLLYTSPSPRDRSLSRMPSSA